MSVFEMLMSRILFKTANSERRGIFVYVNALFLPKPQQRACIFFVQDTSVIQTPQGRKSKHS